MPVSLAEFVKTIDLPNGATAEVAYWTDTINILRDGVEIGTISRREIDDNLAHRKLKEILDDSHNVGERLPDSD